jgi:hypothetical protein
MNVPTSWQDQTSTVQDSSVPGLRYEFVWVFEEPSAVGTSSLVIVSYEGLDMSTAEFADANFAVANQYYPTGEVVVRETFTTAGGIRFERQDLTDTVQGMAVYEVELAAMVNGKGIEIAITLAEDDDRLLDDVLQAVETVVVG